MTSSQRSNLTTNVPANNDATKDSKTGKNNPVEIELDVRTKPKSAPMPAAVTMFIPNLSTYASSGADIPTVVDGADRKYAPVASAIHGSAFGPSRPASSKYDSSKSKPSTYEPIKNPVDTARRRIGLFEFSGPRIKNQAIDEKSAQLLSKYLAGYGRVIGSAYSEGDCFFDAFAQELAQLKIEVPFPEEKPSAPTHINLRQLCNKIVKDLEKSKNENWIKKAIEADGNNYRDYLIAIQHTAPEMEAKKESNIFNGSAILGRVHIEGRMLCQALGVRLHLIEMMIVDGEPVMSHQLIDGQGSAQRDEKAAHPTYADSKTVHLIVYQGSSHFVPTTLPSNPSPIPPEFDTSPL